MKFQDCFLALGNAQDVINHNDSKTLEETIVVTTITGEGSKTKGCVKL